MGVTLVSLLIDLRFSCLSRIVFVPEKGLDMHIMKHWGLFKTYVVKVTRNFSLYRLSIHIYGGYALLELYGSIRVIRDRSEN